jgi:DNA-directed RNA polymerase specialized sigma24 family protein
MRGCRRERAHALPRPRRRTRRRSASSSPPAGGSSSCPASGSSARFRPPRMSLSRRSWPPRREPELFEGRSSLRTRRYRIATNRCPNAPRDKGRRPREVEAIAEAPEATRRRSRCGRSHTPTPSLRRSRIPRWARRRAYEPREAVSPAFVAAPQHPPPRQRAVLVARDAPGLRAAQAADTLQSSEAAVKGALRRARTTPKTRPSARDRERAPPPCSRARAGRSLRPRRPAQRRGRSRLAAERRRPAHDGAPAPRLPGPRGHRAPAPQPRRPARPTPTARSHAGQRSARLWLLPPARREGDRPSLRADGAHARG